jgi:hypothetical protein
MARETHTPELETSFKMATIVVSELRLWTYFVSNKKNV